MFFFEPSSPPVGGAFGKKQGPKILSLKNHPRDKWKTLKFAAPSIHSTASFLLKHFFALKKVHYYPFNSILPCILNNEVDAGAIVHEQGQISKMDHLIELSNLGLEWYNHFKSDLALGCIVASKELSKHITEQICVSISSQSRVWAQ